jgi:uncharacterized membrane protein YagU involved in acid resistance
MRKWAYFASSHEVPCQVIILSLSFTINFSSLYLVCWSEWSDLICVTQERWASGLEFGLLFWIHFRNFCFGAGGEREKGGELRIE